MEITAYERRQKILSILLYQRETTVQKLSDELNVSRRTIQYDIEKLTVSYPIITVRGRYGGGIKIEDWYIGKSQTLSDKQYNLLVEIAETLDGEKLNIMQSIIIQFG